MAEPMKVPFELKTWVGLRNDVLDGGPDPSMRRGTFKGGKGRPTVKYWNTLCWTVQNSWTVWFVGLDRPRESCIRWGPYPAIGRDNFEDGRAAHSSV